MMHDHIYLIRLCLISGLYPGRALLMRLERCCIITEMGAEDAYDPVTRPSILPLCYACNPCHRVSHP